MKVCFGRTGWSNSVAGCVFTLGAFDGLHRGHQQLLARLRYWGDVMQLPTVVLSFYPPPKQYFQQQCRVITPMRDKFALLQSMGVDRWQLMRFDEAMVKTTADEFMQQVLQSQLRAKVCVVGDDCAFGNQRAGSAESLRQWGGWQVDQLATLREGQARVSSSAVRAALSAGDLSQVECLLGRQYQVSGRVVVGAQRAGDWGFPTANVRVGSSLLHIQGVYCVELAGADGLWHPGVACVGPQPDYPRQHEDIEVHLLDFSSDIYGQRVRVRFRQFIRSMSSFCSTEALIEQMQRDRSWARQFFAQ